MKRLSKPIMIVAGVFCIIFGIISIFNPIGALSVLAAYIGLAFFATGIMYVISYIRDYYKSKPSWILTQGLIDLLFGVLLLLNSTVFAFSVAYLIAIWAFITGVLRITSALELKKLNFVNWGILFAIGIISILFSILVFSHPVIGAGLAAFSMGILFISIGLGTLTECFMI